MNNEKKLSIIVPVYNREKSIERCIKSIMNQTYTNIEIIIVDDGSKDNTPKICKELQKKDKRIKYIQQKNSGVAEARNTGLVESSGNYIGFVDSDDYIEKNMYETLITEMESSKSDIAFCNYNIVDSNNKKNRKKCINKQMVFSANELIKKVLLENEFNGVCWNRVFDRKIVQDTKFDKRMGMCEDLEFLMKIIPKCNKISYVNKELYNYVLADQNITTQNYYNSLNKWDCEVRYCNSLIKKYDKTDIEIYAKKRYARINVSIYRNLKKEYKELSKKYRKNALKYFYRIIFSNKIPIRFRMKLVLVKLNLY